MTHINGGVRAAGSNNPIETKTRLKEALKHAPSAVFFYPTARDFGEQYTGTLDHMPEHVTLDVVGPNPYNDRRWYASVTRTEKGFKVT